MRNACMVSRNRAPPRCTGRLASRRHLGTFSTSWSMAPLHARPARTAPRLLVRQRQLLHLLDALGGGVPAQDLVHLLALYCAEAPSAASYEFVPHHGGAFSFTLEADRRKLSE